MRGVQNLRAARRVPTTATLRALLVLVLLAVSSLWSVATAAPSAAAAPTFRFAGGGFGHGVGMGQYGARGQADAGRDGAVILRHYYQGAGVGYAPMRPSIRVGLLQGTGQMSVRSAGGLFGSNGSLEFRWSTGNRIVPAGETWQVRAVGSGWQLFRNGAVETAVFFGGLQLHFGARNSLVSVLEAGHTYRWGTLDLVHRADPSFDAVVDIGSYEAYLYGLAEMPSSWPMYALHAQAVAGRTYALEKARRLGDFRAGCSCTVYATVSDQAYAGYDKEAGPSGSRWVQAVNETAGQLVLRNGAPIQALYSSSSGGHTENNEFAFGGSALPYLRGVPDPWDATPSNPNHTWAVSLSQAQVTTGLNNAGLGVGTVTQVATVPPYGVSGRVGAVDVTGTAGSRRISASQLRSALGLKSTLFRVQVSGGSAAKPAVVRGDYWYLRASFTTGVADSVLRYGNPGDTPLMGDWNRDGYKTPGVFRDGFWYLRNAFTTGTADIAFRYGEPGDEPVVGDWDGDGIATPGVVRGDFWYLRNSNTTGNADAVVRYGDLGDIPVVGDWNGDSYDTPGVVRGGFWYLRNSNTTGVADAVFRYGEPADVPVVGDWGGDGVDNPGVVRQGFWYLRNSNTTGVAEAVFRFGEPADVPVTWSHP